MMTTRKFLISSIPTLIRDDMAFKKGYPNRLQSQESLLGAVSNLDWIEAQDWDILGISEI